MTTFAVRNASFIRLQILFFYFLVKLLYKVLPLEGESCSPGDEVCQVSNGNDECQLYLAPSSIPNAGIGVYTAVDYKEGDRIGENDFIIPISQSPSDGWLIDDVEWNVDLDPRLVFDSDPSKMSLFVPGFGAQINCHFGLNNLYHGKPEYDSAGLHRSKDPGAGAFTYWYNMPNFATRDIVAGEELFVDYGHGWFNTRSYMGEVPKEEDFELADVLVRKLHSINSKMVMAAQSSSDWNVSTSPQSALQDLWSMVRHLARSTEAFQRALPQKYEDIEDALLFGAARHSIGGASSIRSKEWLKENGRCLDNLYVNISTIPQAGRGAFAKRFLPKDSIVAPVPVLQIHSQQVYSEQTGFQLLYNYAFGHPTSNILLLPYSSTVNFINHDRSLPNVKLRWSNSTLHKKEFLDLPPADVLSQGFGLFMELIALRDIQPNEEILCDYGAKWESAWKKHVVNWRPTAGSENYTTAKELIDTTGILTIEEQKENAYPNDVRTACHFAHSQDTVYQNVAGDEDLVTVYTAEWGEENYDCLRYCTIHNRSTTDGKVFYDIEVDQMDHHDSDCRLPLDEKIFVHNVPSEAVTLMDVERSRDQYLPNTFRHFIQLSDDIYPVHWRQDTVPSKQHNDQCQLYLAESSIPNSGFGVYTASNIKKGEFFGEQEMLIALSDRESRWLIRDVVWDLTLHPLLYYESDDAQVFYPGFGAQVNCHFGLNNIDHGSPKFDSTGLHRSKDPGAGAFTYWHGMPSIATRDIQAGEELLIDYGNEDWFDLRMDSLGVIPRERDFLHADHIIRKMLELSRQSNTVEEDTIIFNDLWDIVRNVSSPAIQRALPERYGQLEEVLVSYGTARYSVGGLSSIRSQEWLNQNGMCMDNIYVNNSTIPQAGRGAFAKRFLPKGSLVSPAPVLQIHRGSLYRESVGFELLYNYALGHPFSSVFLILYGASVNFINHNGKNPNVKLQWSTSSLHRKEFLELPSEQVLDAGFGLLMECVALRDIEPHEEIFLDYGEEWERAWLEHVRTWEPIPGSETYVSASDAVEAFGILTVDEQKSKPYPEHLQTACYFYHTSDTSYYNENEVGSMWVQWEEKNRDCLRWCNILDRRVEDDGSVSYDALVSPQDSMLHQDCKLSEHEKIYISGIPIDAVTLVDESFSRDQYMSNVFRQYIRLSDDLFPTAWVNKYNTSMR